MFLQYYWESKFQVCKQCDKPLVLGLECTFEVIEWLQRSHVLDEKAKDQINMTKGKSLQNILWSNHLVKINNDNYVYVLIKYLHTEQCVWGKSNAD